MTSRSTPNKLTRADLLDAAGPVYFARGEGYHAAGAVQAVRERNGVVRATVRGAQAYKTTLAFIDGHVDGHCSCPLGRDGEFCKHLVATGLAWMAEQAGGEAATEETRSVTPKEIEAYLLKLKRPELVRLVMEQADQDDDFHAMLKLRVAAAGASSDTKEMRQVLRQAMTIRGFVEWRGTGAYTRRVDRVLDQLRTMLTPRHAAAVIELAEYGLDLWEKNIERIDDSDGCMGMIRDELHELHLEACRLARPDPVALADRLTRRAIETHWDMFHGFADTYREILGEAGRARHREIVEAEWDALPTLAPGEEDPECFGRTGTIENMMLAMAEEEKDLDWIIRVLSRDLSSSYDYLRIAQRCREARQYALARDWAERGLAAALDLRTSDLRSFLAEEYLRAKRPDDAMAMVWANFEGRPDLKTYQDLAALAQKLKGWEDWRPKAFAHIRQTIQAAKSKHERQADGHSAGGRGAAFRWVPPAPDHSLLVAVLLWEKREEEAWEEAQAGGCADHLWLDLAQRREEKHPADAAGIYRRLVKPLIEAGNNPAYEQAVVFLGRAHGLMKTLGQEAEFRVWLLQLKVEYRRKRNFIKYVERTPWGKGA